MAAVVAELKPDFAGRGFRKRRSTFNREAEPGIVHVVAFQMGRYELYGEQHDPFTGEYGRFWIAWGVDVDAIARRFGRTRPPDFVPEPACEIRLESGTGGGPREGWYLGDETDRLAAAARTFLETHVFPYLDGLSSLDGIVAAWERDPSAVPFSRRRLSVALLELDRANVDRGLELLREHVEAGVHPSHREWLIENVVPQFGDRAPAL